MTKNAKMQVTFVITVACIVLLMIVQLSFDCYPERVDDTKKIEELNDSLLRIIERYKVIENMAIVKEVTQPFSDSAFIQAMIKMKIKHPQIVYAQAVLETGNFTSSLCVNHKNLFGMRPAKSRLHFYSYVTKTNYAGYDSWYLSLMDYAVWQLAYAKDLTEKEYYAFIQRNYSETHDYVSRVKIIVERNKDRFYSKNR